MALLAHPEKTQLLGLARGAIHGRLWKGGVVFERVENSALASPSGAFVTLHLEEQLRGCIGRIRTADPLFWTVQEMALAAAFEDPRFPPVVQEEFSGLAIEISVLSPPEPLREPEQIEVGRHGLIVSKGPYSGLLLPQVAIEWGWDRETFLAHTCVKAGLPEDFWKYGEPRIEIFSAEVFSEKDLAVHNPLASPSASA